MKITNPKVNHLRNPLGFVMEPLRVTWAVEEAVGTRQAWARVQVSTNESMEPVLYDSGKDSQASSLGYALPIALEPRTRYYWTVEVADNTGDTAKSEVQWFETAKETEAWQAKWLTKPELDTENPLFRRSFTLPAAAENARLYIVGLGEYQVYLNGQKVGNEYLTPDCNNYDAWIQYQTYELSLQPGENNLSVLLGNGWYKGDFVFHHNQNIYGSEFLLLAELRAQLQDGSEFVLGTDEDWTVSTGPLSFNNIYDGEVVDPAAIGCENLPAPAVTGPFEKLSARRSLPVVIKEERPVQEVIHTPKGEIVLDMGQNFSGFLRFRAHEPAGTRIHLQYGEVLQEGCFYNANLRSAKAEYTYISDGTEQIVEPCFTFYGFRYVKVEGLTGELNPEDFTGVVLYSDMDMTGSFTTDHAKVNQLISNAIWGQRSNYVDVPTDCPQRDERLGWTGDAQIFAGTACLNMDVYAFLNKYCYDLYTTQQTLGHVTHVIPAFTLTDPTCSAWGDAATVIPWTLYLYYGDKAILEQQYESMKAWADYIRSRDEAKGGARLWQGDFTFGDWLAMDHENPQERSFGGTDPDYVSSAYYFYSTRLVEKAAIVLGKTEDAVFYHQAAEEIKAAIQREYFTTTGRLAVTTQTGYVLALFFGFAPEASRPRLIAELKKKLKDNRGYLKTGFVGTAYIMKALSENGLNDLAYGLLLNEEAPSWLYAVNLGATTIWERWNSMLADGSVNGTDMNSFNHYAYGAVVEWMYQYMAGLKPCEDVPGFKKVTIEPMVDERIRKVDAVYASAAGTYEVHWNLTDENELELTVVVPFDAQALLRLPLSEEPEQKLAAGTYHFRYAYKKGEEA